MNATFSHAKRLGAGATLTDGRDRFLVSDYSPATGEVYGWRLAVDGERGAYLKLPADLKESR